MIARAMQLLRIKVREEDPNVSLKRLTNENSAAYGSQSNGGTEVGVKLVRGLFRTLKLCLERPICRSTSRCNIPWFFGSSSTRPFCST